MLCNAKQSIQELERINQCQQNYINELLNKNNLYNQNNNSLLDDKLVNCEKYFSNLPKTTSIDYDNYNLKCDYEKKLNFDYNIDNNCIKNSPRYFEKLLNLTYSYGKNMTPNILNQSSVNSTQLSQMNNFPESFNNSEMNIHTITEYKKIRPDNLKDYEIVIQVNNISSLSLENVYSDYVKPHLYNNHICIKDEYCIDLRNDRHITSIDKSNYSYRSREIVRLERNK